ncbi:4'-phosphopantetheinyl transferase family protein [Salisaeta longa]|uniref:4'-phosphopantetheinyl transferase family protein n=1 Tax=Salisaeta longa TaxID=503170 RepID=UPI0003B55CAC|nr:4'-phosphopantetheinyl transferase superfamily protein [Salisaeta longa]
MTLDAAAGSVAARCATVHLRTCTYTAAAAARWHAWLSPPEQARVASFGHPKRQRAFVCGRAAARQALGQVLERPPAEVPLIKADDGGVTVAGTPWHCSIAHSGPYALAACARHPVGGDLEKIQPRDASVRRFLFAPEQRTLPDTLPYPPDSALILCWTLKEAVLKAQRTGFQCSPKHLYLTVHPDARFAVADLNGARWHVHFAQGAGYWLSVAVPASLS